MRHATIDDAPGVADLLARCTAVDGRPPLSEFKALRVPVANGIRSLVADRTDGRIEALAVGAWHAVEPGEDEGYWAAEIAVTPELRSATAYGAAYEALRSDLKSTPSLWTFDAAQRAGAEAAGLKAVRSLVEMGRDLPAPAPELPSGYSLQAFRPGRDERLWLTLNQQVFSHHPEAGSIDSADLALRMAQSWFDPEGLLILQFGEDAIGYCWTKRHDATVGEIYMIGLVPEFRGKGLARPLTGAGLAYLHRSGAAEAILYAEADNAAAVGLYERMGFAVLRRISLYAPGPT